MGVWVREPFAVDEISVLISGSPCVDLLGFDKQQASHHSGPIHCLSPACTYLAGPLSTKLAAPVGLLCTKGCPHNCLSLNLLLYKEMAHRGDACWWVSLSDALGGNLLSLLPFVYLFYFFYSFLMCESFRCVTSMVVCDYCIVYWWGWSD